MSKREKVKILLISGVMVSISGCCHPTSVAQRWATEWANLPSSWRTHGEQKTDDSDERIQTIYSGVRGFRFLDAHVWVYADFHRDEVIFTGDQPSVVKIVWPADPNACNGIAFRLNENTVRVLLILDRETARHAVLSNLILQRDTGDDFAILPKLTYGYDLDIESKASIPIEVFYPRCVAAEARVLAASEMKRLKNDYLAGRLNNESLYNYQKGLIRYLASGYELCRDE